MPTKLRATAPYLILAAILISSLLVLRKAPPELLQPHALSLLGPIIIFIAWFRFRSQLPLWQLLPAFAIILFVYLRGQLFHQISQGETTFDEYLLFTDSGFGFNPSLAAYSLVDRLSLFPFISFIYQSLTLAMALCYAVQLHPRLTPSRKALRVFALLAIPAILGPLAYKLLPACGPVWLLGSSCYTGEIPSTCATISLADLARLPLDPAWPRNAIPSLHLTWALLIWWSCRDSKYLRWFALAFACFTALATLGGGEHYLVDLVAAFPFSLIIWSLCMGNLPLSAPQRILPLAGSIATLLLWIESIRFYPALFAISPILTISISLLIISATLFTLHRLWPVNLQSRTST